MLVIKLLALAVALVIFVAVGVRNTRRDFHPALQSHIELFLAGAPIGFIGMLILIPNWPEALVFGAVAGVLTGLSLSYRGPRQWRYWNVPRLPKKE